MPTETAIRNPIATKLHSYAERLAEVSTMLNKPTPEHVNDAQAVIKSLRNEINQHIENMNT